MPVQWQPQEPPAEGQQGPVPTPAAVLDAILADLQAAGEDAE